MGVGGVGTGCLPDDCSVSSIIGSHLLSSIHKGKVCVWECVHMPTSVCLEIKDGVLCNARGFASCERWMQN